MKTVGGWKDTNKLTHRQNNILEDTSRAEIEAQNEREREKERKRYKKVHKIKDKSTQAVDRRETYL